MDARLCELLVGGEHRVEGGGMRGDEGLRLGLQRRYGGDMGEIRRDVGEM